MAAYRRKKEEERNSGKPAVSSSQNNAFADIERQQRQEAQRAVQTVSRESKVDTKQAERTMDNIVAQQSRSAKQLEQAISDKADPIENYVEKGTAELAENLTHKVDKRGSGAVGDDLLAEIAGGQSLETLEHQQKMQDLHDRLVATGQLASDAVDYSVMGGKQLARGAVNTVNEIVNKSQEGFKKWYDSDPEGHSYEQYAARNAEDPNVDLTDMTVGMDIYRNADSNYDFIKNRPAEWTKEMADSLSDTDLYMIYMRDNPEADPSAFDPETVRQGIKDQANVGSDEWFTGVYDSLENDLSNTEAGMLLENVGANATRGLLASGIGSAFSLAGLDPLAATKVASNALMAYGISGTQTGQKIDEGYDPNRALAYGLASGLNEMGQEQIGEIGGFVGDKLGVDTSWLFNQTAAGMPMGLRDWSGEFVEEGVGQFQEPLMDLILNPDMTVGEAVGNMFTKENLDASLRAGVEGFLSAGISSGLAHPAQTAQMVRQDIQDLQNLPAALDHDTKVIANKLNKTNEYEKALKQNLVQDQEAQIEMMPEGAEKEAAKKTLNETKSRIRDQYLSNENLRSDDALVRDAAQAANSDYIHEQVAKLGKSTQVADTLTLLSNRAGMRIELNAADSVVDDQGNKVKGIHYDDGRIVISDEARATGAVGAHEVTHEIRGTKAYNRLRQFLETAVGNGTLKIQYGTVNNLQNRIIANYGIDNIADEFQAWDLLDDETSAYLVEELFDHEEAIEFMADSEPGLAQNILEGLQRFSAKIAKNQAELDRLDQRRTIRKAVKMFQEAIDAHNELEQRIMGADLGKEQGETRYSIGIDTDGVPIFGHDEINAELAKQAGNSINARLNNYLKQKYGTRLVNIAGIYDAIYNDSTSDEYAWPSKYLSSKKYNAKAQVATDLEAVLRNAKPLDFGIDKKGGNKPFDHFKTTFGIQNADKSVTYYTAVVSAKVYPDNNVRFYDLSQFKEKGTSSTVTISPAPGTSTNTVANQGNKSSGNTVSYSRNLDASEYRADGSRKDLRAIHNLRENNLRKTMELGGMVMPSIAVTKDSVDHSGFGDISVVFDKDTIDPSNSKNRVYKRDAWTPTFPQPEVEVDSDKIYDLRKRIDQLTHGRQDMFGYIGLDPSNVSDRLDRFDGDPVEAYKDVPGMKLAYAAEKGIDVPVSMKDSNLGRGFATNEDIINIYDLVGKDFADRYIKGNSFEEFKNNQGIVDRVKEYLINRYDESRAAKGRTKTLPNGQTFGEKMYGDLNHDFSTFDALMRGVYRYAENESIPQEVDIDATRETLNETIDQQDYERWLNKAFKGVVKSKGLRKQNVDPFTRSGNRKSFKQTHDPYTAEGVLKNMLSQDEAGGSGFGSGYNSALGAYLGRFNNLNDIIANEEQLSQGDIVEDDLLSDLNHHWSELREEVSKATGITNTWENYESFQEAASEFARSRNHSVENAKKIFKPYLFDLTTDQAQELIDLLEEGKSLTTDYFEAKPRRIVRPDEWKQVYAPNTTDPELLQQLRDMGVETIEYDPNIEGDRQAKMNENARRYQFSRNLDSSGRELSEGQQSFFSESKIRDDEGRLLTTYHGTPNAGFTIYDRSKLGSTTHAKDASVGFHFTDSKELADSFGEFWGDKGEVKEQYLNITNPLDINDVIFGSEYTEEQRQKLDRDMKYILTGDADYVADWEDDGWDTYDDILSMSRQELAAMKDELADPDAIERMRELGYDGLILPLQENDVTYLERHGYPYQGKREFITFESEQAKNVDNLNPTANKDIRFSRNLMNEDDLKALNPYLAGDPHSNFGNQQLTRNESFIRKSSIDPDVFQKAIDLTAREGKISDFEKRFNKKSKRVSDMIWIGNMLRTAQAEVDSDRRVQLGAQAFGEAQYRDMIRKLRDEGISNAELLVDDYLQAIDYKGTDKADALLADRENGSRVAQEVKLNLKSSFIDDMVKAQRASIEKRNKTRMEGLVPGTEAYWRKTLKNETKQTKESMKQRIPWTYTDADINTNGRSAMSLEREFGSTVAHSPIGDSRELLRRSGITKTADYSDFFYRLMDDTLNGREHDASMLSRFRDSILNNEQIAADSEMANGGFEFMIEQLDQATRDLVEANENWYEAGNEWDARWYTRVPTKVRLTENDHADPGKRIYVSGLLGTVASDTKVTDTIRVLEDTARAMSENKMLDTDNAGDMMNYVYQVTGNTPLSMDDASVILPQIYRDMQLDHGRNSRGQYVEAPTPREISMATAERRARSAENTRAFFNNRDSLDEMVETIPFNEDEWQADYDAMFGEYDDAQYQEAGTSTFGADDYQFPTDEDAPAERPSALKKTQSAVQGIGLSDDEVAEATRGVDQGYVLNRENYIPGKLDSEMSEDDRSEARKAAEQMRSDIDTWMAEGQNLGSMAKSQEQNRDQMADGNERVNDAIKRIVEDPFYEAKKRMFQHYKEQAKKLAYITDELGIKAGSKESAAVQWYMEQSKDTNAENQDEVRYTLLDLKREFPDTWENLKKAADMLTEMYDDYYTKINEALEMIYPEKALLNEAKAIREKIDNQLKEKQAYLERLLSDRNASRDEINRYRREIKQLAKKYNQVDRDVRLNKRLPLRQNYAHHFMDVKPNARNIWGAFMDVLNNTGSNNISNELADISEWTQPNARWWGAMQQRNSGEYTSDAVGGMLRYMDRAEQKIFIDPYTAYMRGVISEMKKSADEAGRDMSTTIRYYSAWVNDLAGKTNPYDRWLTYAANGKGRQVLTLLKMLNSRVKSNAVMGNLNSAIAQFYNLPNGIAIMQEKGGVKAVDDWRKGLSEYMTDKFSPDRAVDQSVFLTERFFDDFTSPLMDLSTPQKFTSALMEFGDRAVAEQIWYAAKAQGERLGVNNPIQYADELTRRSVAGRGIGEVALQQKSEVVKILAPFQVEVNNQWQLMKHLVGEKQAASLIGLFLSTFLMNLVKKKVTGTEGTGFDLFQAIIDAFDENEGVKDTVFGILGNVTGETLSNMTMGALISELAGLGGDSYTSYFGEHDPTRYGIGNIGVSGLIKPAAQIIRGEIGDVDWTKLATNYLLPYGGRQAERTVKSLQDMGILPHFGNGNYDLKEGAYTKSGDLKYLIDKDNPLDVARSLLFGSYASEGGQNYLENRQTLGAKSVDVMNTLADAGVPSVEAYNAMMSIKDSNIDYPRGLPSSMAAPSVARRKALEDAGVWDEWSEAYNNMDEDQQKAFREGTGGIAKGVAAMDDEEFQRAYDAVFGTGATQPSAPASSTESLSNGSESAVTLSPSRQTAYDTVSNADLGVDSDRLQQTMGSLESQNVVSSDGTKIQNSKAAINRSAYEEDGSYQIIVDFVNSEENQSSDDPLTFADFGLSKAVVGMSDEEYRALLETVDEETGSSYSKTSRRSGGSSRGNSRRANAFTRSGTSVLRSITRTPRVTTSVSGSSSRSRSSDLKESHASTISRLRQRMNNLSNGVMLSDQDLYDRIFNS